MPQLGDPEDERRDGDDQEPVLEAQPALDGIEEALQPGDLDQGDLPEEDHEIMGINSASYLILPKIAGLITIMPF